MEKKSLSYKTDLQELGKNKVIFIVAWCNYISILSFLSTLHFMLENWQVCLWLPGIDHICAKSDRRSTGFTSLEFFASCDSLTLTSLPALSPSFPASPTPGQARPAQWISLILPFTLQATAQRPCHPHSHVPPSHPRMGLSALEGASWRSFSRSYSTDSWESPGTCSFQSNSPIRDLNSPRRTTPQVAAEKPSPTCCPTPTHHPPVPRVLPELIPFN